MLKKFYTPSKSKIILTIILAIANTASAFYAIMPMFCTEGCPGQTLTQALLFPSLFPFAGIQVYGILNDINYIPELISITIGAISTLTIAILFWYTLSCLIIKTLSHKTK